VQILNLLDKGFDWDGILNCGDEQRSSAVLSNLSDNLSQLRKILCVVIGNLLVLLFLLVSCVLAVSVVASNVVCSLLLGHVGVHELATIKDLVVAKGGLEHEVVAVVELTLTVHLAVPPMTDVNMATLTLVLALLWPNKATITTFDAVDQASAVLTTILVDHVTVTGAFVMIPVTGVTTITVGVNLDTESMTNGHEFLLKLICDLCDIFDNKWLIETKIFIISVHR